MGTSIRSSNSRIRSLTLAATLIAAVGLGFLIPADADAFNLRSTLATPPVAISPATDTESGYRLFSSNIKGKSALQLAASDASPARHQNVVDHEAVPGLVELSGAWSMENRGAGTTSRYASLVPSYIPPELRLLLVLESLSAGSPSAMPGLAPLSNTLSAKRPGPDAGDDPVVTLQVLLGGNRSSQPRRIGSRWKPAGGRLFVDLARRWTLALRGDARGLRGSGSSDMSWNVIGSVGRNIGDLLEVRLGYRVSRLDPLQSKDGFGVSRLIQGPQLGFVLDF